MTTTTRRAILAGLAAAPVAGLPALAMTLPGADPIFAAIEEHKAAWTKFSAESDRTDNVLAAKQGRVVTDEDEAAYEAADNAERAARDALIATVPTTLSGARAALEWLVEYDAGCVPDASGRFVETLLASPVLLRPAAAGATA